MIVALMYFLKLLNSLGCFASSRASARKELYKKVWIELDGMVKQTVKKTCGQEELARAIAIAGADCGVVEESKH